MEALPGRCTYAFGHHRKTKPLVQVLELRRRRRRSEDRDDDRCDNVILTGDEYQSSHDRHRSLSPV